MVDHGCHLQTEMCHMSAIELVTATFQIGAKGRAVIPVAVRRAANIHENDTVVAHVNALGQVVIETEEALKARLWAASRTGSRGG